MNIFLVFIFLLFFINWLVLKFQPIFFGESTFFSLGAVFGLFSAFIVESLTRSNLSVSILDDDKNTIGGPVNNKRWKFLHLKVTNHRYPKQLRWLLDRKAALLCKAEVAFLDHRTKGEIFKVGGRWSSTGEPITPIPGGVSFDPSKVPSLQIENILPGETALLAVAVKVEGEASCTGFSNWSYAFIGNYFKNPEWELPEKRYIIQVKITHTSGDTKREEFLLHNLNGQFRSFKLLEIRK